LIDALKKAFPSQKSTWDIVKLHLMSRHLVDAIKRAGVPEEFSCNMFESFHVVDVKRPSRASNCRDYLTTIINHHNLRLMLHHSKSSIPDSREYRTAMDAVSAWEFCYNGIPELWLHAYSRYVACRLPMVTGLFSLQLQRPCWWVICFRNAEILKIGAIGMIMCGFKIILTSSGTTSSTSSAPYAHTRWKLENFR